MGEQRRYAADLVTLPAGSVIAYMHSYYWLCEGLEGRIIINNQGQWRFIKDLAWKTFRLCFLGPDDARTEK